MASPSYSRSLVGACKRLKLSSSAPKAQTQVRHVQQSAPKAATPSIASIEDQLNKLRLPKAVQATYLTPLRQEGDYENKVCVLQLRSYSVRNVEIFADFAARAAFYLRLPIQGPRPLRQITERWTVPRSNFVHKKSQENFERKTLRREIKVFDAHPETVAIWLAFLRKHQYYGVGMKANLWEHGSLATAEEMDARADSVVDALSNQFDRFGVLGNLPHKKRGLKRMLLDEPFKASWAANAPLVGTQSAPSVNEKIEKILVKRES